MLHDGIIQLQRLVGRGELVNAWMQIPCLVRAVEVAGRKCYFHIILELTDV